MELGAHAVLDPGSEDVAQSFLDVCGSPPDVVFECVGLPGLIMQAVDLVRSMGRVVVAGACFGSDVMMPMTALRKELSIFFSSAYEDDDFDAVIDNLARERIAPQPLITHSVALQELPQAFEALRIPADQCKVLVEPSSRLGVA
jgi:(R,R)-butanediol dehydrogenase/meso-butanediol dehydrogenase/diacetyl reductase